VREGDDPLALDELIVREVDRLERVVLAERRREHAELVVVDAR